MPEDARQAAIQTAELAERTVQLMGRMNQAMERMTTVLAKMNEAVDEMRFQARTQKRWAAAMLIVAISAIVAAVLIGLL